MIRGGTRYRSLIFYWAASLTVIKPDSTFEFEIVQIGRDNGNCKEIESGLFNGDCVALTINNQSVGCSKVTVKGVGKGRGEMA